MRRRLRALPLAPLALALAAALLVPAGALAYHRGPLWLRSLLPARPPGIVVHHSATPTTVNGKPLTAENLAAAHAERGWGQYYAGRVYHLGYHYLILPDGTVQAARPPWMPGAHCEGHNHMLGICLLGDFSRRSPPAAQLRALQELTGDLLRRYRLSPERVYRHGDLGQTACPGEGFPWEEFRRRLGEAGASPGAG